ncbi:sigma-70 family RNA polymerase sigma factor [Modestobacter roseus]|uniref:DNA-directed RNA polymerase specialized sigma24 family protein n=1 Tax=Modestobacter roseus TaxID=1181884 RepID=A0A562IUX0_9ACTN|nr:sigma-70 family RNA polymerase sigma factor [Modestobacter roseus]MQA33625.1 SigE family RNA polymerase sigma factor [Modestobacter roseus]TWH74742.1 DNA-directed RNA polymerase specialized sigma24 family protein [Modestobacter roseus]
MTDAELAVLLADRGPALLRIAHLLTGDDVQARELVVEALTGVAGRDARTDDRTLRRALVAAHAAWHRRTRVGETVSAVPALNGLARGSAAVTPRTPVGQALAQLPARSRAVLVLRHGEHLSDADVADAVGGDAAAVAEEDRAALARLGARLGGADDDVAGQLDRHLAALAAVTGPPDPDLAATVRDARRSQRLHRAGLVALLSFLLAVAVLVALTVS